jgi:hypothetical protein
VKRGWPFAAVLAAALGLLGFTVVFGVQVVHPDDAHEVLLQGWQVFATQIGLLAAGLVLGTVAALVARRRLRQLEGEGVVFGPPAVLVGVLVAGLCTSGATRAVEHAQLHTSQADRLRAEDVAQLAVDPRHPPVFHVAKPAATAELTALTVRPWDLGHDWYDAARPHATQRRDASSASVMLVRQHLTAQGWEADAMVRETVTRAATEEQVAALLAPATAWSARAGHQRIAGQDVLVATSHDGFGAVVSAWFRRGLLVWEVRVAPMDKPGFSAADVTATLERVVAASTT